ncbi:MAG: hypothetical protein EOP11_11500 [Proteobacteria bacterium]|nr:MAG: hypothetical protein EOP11_11500 [Pseudomonadota bacterium]
MQKIAGRISAVFVAGLVLSCFACQSDPQKVSAPARTSKMPTAAERATPLPAGPECPKRLLVLVPGFFSQPGQATDDTPPYEEDQTSGFVYFSNEILRTAREQGFSPWVVRDLDRFGDFALNGERLLNDFRGLAERFPGCPFSVIAHSAGGLYTAYALTRDPSLPIKNVVTLGTPYQGSELTNLIAWIPGWKKVVAWLNLKSLREFRRDGMGQILSGLRVPAGVRWVALGGSQKPCFLITCSDARSLTWILSTAWNFTSREGDGVVDIESARAKDVVIPTVDGASIKPEQWLDLPIPLDHWKMTQEAERFAYLGVLNPGWIREEQRRIYTEILKRL